MFICNSRWTCSGWIFYSGKPHPFWNEWYTDCCALYGILFVVDLVEGKDHHHQYGPLEFEDLGRKTVGLLLQIMERYFYTGGYVIIDSGFCVLEGLIHLKNKGIFNL